MLSMQAWGNRAAWYDLLLCFDLLESRDALDSVIFKKSRWLPSLDAVGSRFLANTVYFVFTGILFSHLDMLGVLFSACKHNVANLVLASGCLTINSHQLHQHIKRWHLVRIMLLYKCRKNQTYVTFLRSTLASLSNHHHLADTVPEMIAFIDHISWAIQNKLLGRVNGFSPIS